MAKCWGGRVGLVYSFFFRGVFFGCFFGVEEKILCVSLCFFSEGFFGVIFGVLGRAIRFCCFKWWFSSEKRKQNNVVSLLGMIF